MTPTKVLAHIALLAPATVHAKERSSAAAIEYPAAPTPGDTLSRPKTSVA